MIWLVPFRADEVVRYMRVKGDVVRASSQGGAGKSFGTLLCNMQANSSSERRKNGRSFSVLK